MARKEESFEDAFEHTREYPAPFDEEVIRIPLSTSKYPEGALLQPRERLYSIRGFFPRYHRIDPEYGPIVTGKAFFTGAFKVGEEATGGRRRLLGATLDYKGPALIEGIWQQRHAYSEAIIQFLKWYHAVNNHPSQPPIGYLLTRYPKDQGFCDGLVFFEGTVMDQNERVHRQQIVTGDLEDCRVELITGEAQGITIAPRYFPGHINRNCWAEDIKKLPFDFDKMYSSL